MPFPIEIIVHEAVRSEGFADVVRRKATELEMLCPRITHCQVVVEQPTEQNPSGVLLRVSIQLSAPMGDLKMSDVVHEEYQHEDPYFAANLAFDAIRNTLNNRNLAQRNNSKSRLEFLHGQVAKIRLPKGPDYPEQGDGFISTCDGREIYFHAKSLEDTDFQRLELGSEVEFEEALGGDGTQAVCVRLVGQKQLHLVE